jgi:tRNA threonylcarbamoyladenosine biosynthesis protein TsaE
MIEKFSIISDCEEDTGEVARKIAPLFHAGDIIILDGDLGAGKTCFVKGFTDGFRSNDVVTSPTFSIANFYRTGANGLSNILHIDLYRIANIDEFNDLGLFDYFDQSVTLIEWGKQYMTYFDACLLISFQIVDDNKRVLTFEIQGDTRKSILTELKMLLKGDELC